MAPKASPASAFKKTNAFFELPIPVDGVKLVVEFRRLKRSEVFEHFEGLPGFFPDSKAEEVRTLEDVKKRATEQDRRIAKLVHRVEVSPLFYFEGVDPETWAGVDPASDRVLWDDMDPDNQGALIAAISRSSGTTVREGVGPTGRFLRDEGGAAGSE